MKSPKYSRGQKWNLENSVRDWATAVPRCQLLLAEAARLESDYASAKELTRKALDKGRETSAQNVLVSGYLALARLMLDLDDFGAAEQAVQEGLRIAEHCGYGIYFIDLLVTR